METTELGFTYEELFEIALSIELVNEGDEYYLDIEELQELLSNYAGDIL